MGRKDAQSCLAFVMSANTYSSEDNHRSCCHATFSALDDYSFSEHMVQCEAKQKVDPKGTFHGSDVSLTMRFRLLKAMLAVIEVSIPSEALQPFWTDTYRKSWGVKLQTSSSAEELLQVPFSYMLPFFFFFGHVT
ncbi:homeobox-DDT domain protein RLT2-like [Telopea speciosissima]|uniref:homeobox-DDT domain protein RLT2-like n=1 Tax=Telopea speciosissima TaxID=54955 RepID=UPI001CC39CED|nr:homeobox-DDT domain protein RLT2-like [Telopea speciosissima]